MDKGAGGVLKIGKFSSMPYVYCPLTITSWKCSLHESELFSNKDFLVKTIRFFLNHKAILNECST